MQNIKNGTSNLCCGYLLKLSRRDDSMSTYNMELGRENNQFRTASLPLKWSSGYMKIQTLGHFTIKKVLSSVLGKSGPDF